MSSARHISTLWRIVRPIYCRTCSNSQVARGDCSESGPGSERQYSATLAIQWWRRRRPIPFLCCCGKDCCWLDAVTCSSACMLGGYDVFHMLAAWLLPTLPARPDRGKDPCTWTNIIGSVVACRRYKGKEHRVRTNSVPATNCLWCIGQCWSCLPTYTSFRSNNATACQCCGKSPTADPSCAEGGWVRIECGLGEQPAWWM